MRKLIISLVSIIFCLTGCMTDHIQPSKQAYVNVKDGKVYYQTFGKGSPVVVLHDGPGLDQGYLLPQMLELAKNHEVTFYDQRGCGNSFNTPINDQVINVEQYVEDLEALRRKLGHEKIALIGHSWGGLLAMHYAVRYPNNVSKLVLMNSLSPTQKSFQSFMDEYSKRMKAIQAELDKIKKTEDFKRGKPQAVEDLCRLIFQNYFINSCDVDKLSLHLTNESAANMWKINGIFSKNHFSKPYDLRKNLKKIKSPTLIIHGDRDIISVWTTQETLQGLPHAKLIVYKNCDHFPFIEKPEQLFQDLNEFLKS